MKRFPLTILPVIFALFFLWIFFEAASPAASSSFQQQSPNLAVIHPELRKAMAEGKADDLLPVIVEWKRDPQVATQAASLASNKLSRRQMVVDALQADTQAATKGLLSVLEPAVRQGSAAEMTVFWASPVIAVETTPDIIQKLSTDPQVAEIRLDQQIFLEEDDFELDLDTTGDGFEESLKVIGVDITQQALGLDGSGVVVANMDTGVDWQHPALLSKYRGYNPNGPSVHAGNWHVSTDEPYTYPGDGNGHGTHTMGTMVGDDGEGNRIGVAPGAQWIAVKIFANAGYTYESWIHDGFQWILAPNGDPALAPDIVNNSWGSSLGSYEAYRPDVNAWIAAGIIPIFSAGNDGPMEATVGSPGSYPESLAVGAVENDKLIASFSSRGPSPWDEIKPEVVAPGVMIRSSFPGGGYATGNGTSMAAPHVSGLAALLLQANPSLTYSQLESILKNTAEHLGETSPNNIYGWGLINAYSAGIQVSGSGEITGKVTRTDGTPIPYPSIHATPHSGEPAVTVMGGVDGKYRIALLPGLYDLTVDAFGFQTGSAGATLMEAGSREVRDVVLLPSPAGSIFGRITDQETGEPISATVIVENTPLQTQTDPLMGLYSLAVPEGDWSIKVTAEAHRVGHAEVTVKAGQGYTRDFSLAPAPTILLVDSGRWYYESEISYYQDALDELDYNYNLLSIRTFYDPELPDDRPISSTLLAYDVVIWSAPKDSPGMIGSDQAISEYMDNGGHLLISGQDVAYWDAGGNIFSYLTGYLFDRMKVQFKDEGLGDDLSGVIGTPLEGMNVELNTPDSAMQQANPDAVNIRNPVVSVSTLEWPENFTGGVVSGICKPFRSAWLGFGLEGAGPRDLRIELMDRVIQWLEAPPEDFGFLVPAAGPALIGTPGSTVEQVFKLSSTGILTDVIDVTVEGGSWPFSVELPDGTSVQDQGAFTLGACNSATITVTVSIPPGVQRHVYSDYAITFTSESDVSKTKTTGLSVKTPAPVLLVDNEKWYSHIDDYQDSLEKLGVPYDIFNMNTSSLSVPSVDTLDNYPTVAWITGYNWYNPLAKTSETNLAAYLDQGGGLLVTSQDAIDVVGVDQFIQERLGVASTKLSVESSAVTGYPNTLLNADLSPWALHFPFTNWVDAIYPNAGVQRVMQDLDRNPLGLYKDQGDWRTAFFSFPLETLNPDPMDAILRQTLLWLGPFGESNLTAPPSAEAGETIPITLTLGLSRPGDQENLSAILPLPEGTSLIDGSLTGEWTYDTESGGLSWEGNLSAGELNTMTAQVQIDPDPPEGEGLMLTAYLSDMQGLASAASAKVLIHKPLLRLEGQVAPVETVLGGTAWYTLTVINAGSILESVHLTATLPAGLEINLPTLSASSGAVESGDSTLSWSGELDRGETAEIVYQVSASRKAAGGTLVTEVWASDESGKRVAWVDLIIPIKVYLPLISR